MRPYFTKKRYISCNMAYNTGDTDIFTENVGCYNLHISGKAKRKELKHYEKKKAISAVLAASMLAAVILPGCGSDENSGKTEIEILQYKPEAATYFDQVEDQFNATHDDIHLTISSPNDATTILEDPVHS